MSAGPIYVTTVNDGAMDELLYMHTVLKSRIDEITAARMAMKQGMIASGQNADAFPATPSMADITQTHTVLPYKSYKPYVSTAFQYSKSRMGSGSGTLGSECSFAQPTYGEFISDSFLMFETNAINGLDTDLRTYVVANPSTLPPNTITVDGTATASVAKALPFAALTASKTNIVTTYHIEDSMGNVLMERSALSSTTAIGALTDLSTAYPSAINVRDYVQYAAFPAHAMIERVAFSITSNEFDFYNQERDHFYVLHQLPEDKKAAYYKCVCQELPIKGVTGLITNLSGTVNGVVTNDNYPSASAQGGVISARQEVNVLAGYQTPKYQQPGLSGLYPNKFDHCRHISNALPILAISYADRTFVYKFAEQSKIAYTSDANLRKVKTVHTIATNALAEPESVKTTTEVFPFKVGSTITQMNLTNMTLYVNNIFIEQSIHSIFLERIGFSITRVHRSQAINVNTPNPEITLTSFKWPLEFMFVGLRPSTNLTVNPQRNWWKYSYNVETLGQSYAQHTSLLASGLYNATGTPVAATGEFYLAQRSLASAQRIVYDLETPPISKLKVTLQTISLFEEMNSNFYNAYLPYALGGDHIKSGTDTSSLFVPFSFTSGSNDELGGHVNLSRSREFMITITSGIVGTGNAVASGVLHTVGIVINFWVVSSGNLYLRFT